MCFTNQEESWPKASKSAVNISVILMGIVPDPERQGLGWYSCQVILPDTVMYPGSYFGQIKMRKVMSLLNHKKL
jgi:hypothetical protein